MIIYDKSILFFYLVHRTVDGKKSYLQESVKQQYQGVFWFCLSPHVKGKFTKNKFQYVKDLDGYVCANNYFLNYKTTSRNSYKEYISNAAYVLPAIIKTNV